MRAIILAAGQGTRLKPYTDDTPKCLLKVGGKEILGWQLDGLSKSGIYDVTIVTGFQHDKVEKFIEKYNHMNVELIYNTQYSTTNNAFSLGLALEENDNGFIVLNGDTICHPDVIRNVVLSPVSNCMAIQKKDYIEEDMKVTVDESYFPHKILEVSKEIKDSYGEFMGIAKFTDNITRFKKHLYECDKNQWFEHAINPFLKQKPYHDGTYMIDVTNFPSIEIDFEEDLLEAREIFIWGMPDWEFGIRHKAKMHQDNALRLLIDTVETFKKHDIKYWLCWGTLLGLVRDGAFISWDTDMDISAHWEDREKIIHKVEVDLIKKGCFIPKEEVCFPEDRWYIRDKEKIQVTLSEDKGDKYVAAPKRSPLGYPKHFLDNLIDFEFKGYTFKVPCHTEEFLELCYGADWKIPKEGKKPARLPESC